jgi:tetratricopeptide (TPR) repeat protein
MKRIVINTIAVAGILLLSALPLMAADTCDLAKEVAGKAFEAYRQDQADGLKLFIKAEQLCPDNPSYAYNLGIAYYRYGRLAEAERYLRRAVDKKPDQVVWLNNLADVLLARGNAGEGLTYARKAYEKSPSAPAADSLVRAHLAAGDHWEALATINKAKAKWPQEEEIGGTYAAVLDQYLTHYLTAIQSGRVEEGLAGLQKVDFDPQGVRAYCLALAAGGRLDDALAAADKAKTSFRDLNETFDELLARKIRTFYESFQAGNPTMAVKAAKEFSERYAAHEKAAKAYSELLEAFLADASTIEVPEAGQVKTAGAAAGGRSEQLLAGLSGSAAPEANLDLTVDVDTEIPQGSLSRPYGVAVVIGNQRYARQNRGIMDVSYAERDAAVIKQYLITTMGFDAKNIIYRTDVTSGDLRNIFGSKENPKGMLHNYIRPGESEVFIYYVGHGAPGPRGDASYLVPVDAQADYIANNGYDLDFFYKMVAELPAREVTVVLDSCFSGDSAGGPLFSKISPAMLRTAKPVRELANAVVFASADQNQVSTWYPAKRHSLFTYFFLKGLGGAADMNRDKAITTGELGTYLAKEVPYWAQRETNRQQNPLLKGGEDTVLAKLR